MALGIFANCTFCVKVKHLPRQQRKKLQTDIKENGGSVSFLLNSQCTHIILDSADILSQYQLNCIQKYHVHITSPDYIWESIKARRLLDVNNYNPNKSLDSSPPPCQEAASCEVNTDQQCPDSALEIESIPELTKFCTEDVEIPPFPQDFEVAKYSILEKLGPEGGQEMAVVELQCSQDSGDPAFRISAHFLPACGTEPRKQFSVKHTSAEASEYYENYIEELTEQGFLPRESLPPEATQLASEKLQALLLEEVIHSSTLSQEVSNLVEMIWAEALGHLEHTLLKSLSRISLNDVSKAEGILLRVKEALKSGEKEEQLQELMSEFYRLIPHRGTAAEEVNLRLLAKKEDLCQLIRDMVNVCETNLSKPNPPSLAKYRALRCKIEHVEESTEEFLRLREEVLQNNGRNSPVDILQVFRVGRVSESTAFQSQLGNVKPLLHGSPARSFMGILSRGLLLPKVVEDRGVKRTDIGNLGSGIYFSNSISTSIKYSHPGETDGTRLLVVCDVALGKCMDLHKKDYSLTEAPPGYDSVHGVPKTATVTTDFEDDEFVVYKTNQVKMRYIIKFCIPGDEVKDFHPCNNTELEEHTPEVSSCSKIEDYQLPDAKTLSSVQAGLQDTCGDSVPLEDLHIKGRIIDFVAQVTVFQTYTNQSNVPIEAKYIFPLDDKAAVCGFEAFINGKHIVGEIKEKEAAHRDYREAISQGHGAYLMDQDVPDVFTVSVGNLPPKAKVLIKITYITELSIQGTVAVFFLPATVAPWQQDKALNENIQATVKKVCIKEIGTKQSFSLSMSIEMPYVIEFISSDTHELKKKSTDCKAVVSTVDGSSLDSSGFSLRIGLSDAYLPRMWVEKHPEKESEACMLVFHPDLAITLPDAAEDSEMVICLDCSNSMEGVTFLQAKQIALYALSLVGKKQKVNIVKFGSGYEELFPTPKCIRSSSTPAEFITSALPTMGNTDFWKTLRYLSLLPPSRGLRNILLVSDGHLQEEGLTLQLVKRHVRHTRLFSCGVGSTANRHILRTLSQCGAGLFEYFNSKSKHSWKKQIEDQMTRVRSPSCHSVSVKWHQLSRDTPEPLQAPAHVQALFHNDRLLVYSFLPHCTQATLCALIQEKEFSTIVSTTELQKTTGTVIHKLTAQALIRDYEDGMLHEDATSHEMKKQILKSLIIQLSKENSLITQFTSFVAVEKRDGNESPFPNTPNILELIAKEDVDFLPYMGWQEERPGASMPQALSASPEWHEELKVKCLAKKKHKSSKLKVLKGSEKLGLGPQLPEEFVAQSSECRDVERPLDLSQIDSLTHLGIKPKRRTKAILSKRVCSSSAVPGSANFLAASPVGFASPCPPNLLPQSSLFGPLASAKPFGPDNNDQGLETSHCTGISVDGVSPNLHPQDPPFTGSAFSGIMFSSRSTMYEGPWFCPTTSGFLELDSPPKQFLSDSSPLHFPNPPIPLSTSYKQPIPLKGFTFHEASPLFEASLSSGASPPSGASPSFGPPPPPGASPSFRPPPPSGASPSFRSPLPSGASPAFRPPPPPGASPSFRPPPPPGASPSFRPPPPSGASPSFRSPPSHGASPLSGASTLFGASPSFKPPLPSGASPAFRPPPPPGASPSFRPPPPPGASPSFRPPSPSGASPSFRSPPSHGASPLSGASTLFGASLSFKPPLPSGASPSFRPPPPSGASPSFRSPPSHGASPLSGASTLFGASPSFKPPLPSGASPSFRPPPPSEASPSLGASPPSEASPSFRPPPPFGTSLSFRPPPPSEASPSFGASPPSGASPSFRPPPPSEASLSFGAPLSGAFPSNISMRTALTDFLPNTCLDDALRSFETESDETPGFLANESFEMVKKSDRRRDCLASSLVLSEEDDIDEIGIDYEEDEIGIDYEDEIGIDYEDEIGIDYEESWRDFVPVPELFSLQTEDGFWKLTPALGFILNLNTTILRSFLEQKGIQSLGMKGRECLLDLIATLLVLQFLRTKLEQMGIVFKSLMKLDDDSISRNISWNFEKIKKASEWVRRTEGQYSSICQRLELGKDWDSATKQLLGIQPMNTTSPLHRVLNYGQG